MCMQYMRMMAIYILLHRACGCSCLCSLIALCTFTCVRNTYHPYPTCPLTPDGWPVQAQEGQHSWHSPWLCSAHHQHSRWAAAGASDCNARWDTCAEEATLWGMSICWHFIVTSKRIRYAFCLNTWSTMHCVYGVHGCTSVWCSNTYLWVYAGVCVVYVVHVRLSLPHPSCRLQLALIKWRPVETHSQFFVQLLLQTAAQQALQWNAVHSRNNTVTALLIFCSKIKFDFGVIN